MEKKKIDASNFFEHLCKAVFVGTKVAAVLAEGAAEALVGGVTLTIESIVNYSKNKKIYNVANEHLKELEGEHQGLLDELLPELLSLKRDTKKKPVKGKDIVKYLLSSLQPFNEKNIRGLKSVQNRELSRKEVDGLIVTLMNFKMLICDAALKSMNPEDQMLVQVLAVRMKNEFHEELESLKKSIFEGLYPVRYKRFKKCPICGASAIWGEHNLKEGYFKCKRCGEESPLKELSATVDKAAVSYIRKEIENVGSELSKIEKALTEFRKENKEDHNELKKMIALGLDDNKEIIRLLKSLEKKNADPKEAAEAFILRLKTVFKFIVLPVIAVIVALIFIFTFRDKTLKDKATGVTAVAEFSDFGLRKSGVKLKVAEITPENADFGAVANMLSAHHAEGVAYEAYSISFVRRNGTLADLKRKSDGIEVTVPLDEGFIHKQNTKAYILSETEQPLALDADLTSSTLRFNTSGIDISEVIIVCIQEPFAVSFEGLDEETQYLWYGEKATLPEAIPAKVGYSFAKWGVKEGEEIKPFDFSAEAIKSGTQLVPIFTPLNYSVTIEGEEEITVTFDRPYTLPQAQATAGYHFVRYEDEQGQPIAREGVWTIPENCTLTAVFEANEYVIRYDPNGIGAIGTIPDTECVYDTQANITAQIFERKGYTFLSWNSKSDGNGKSYSAEDAVDNLSTENGGTAVLYAQWEPISYVVSYLANDGSEKEALSSVHLYDTAQALAGNVFTRVGYTFAGWNTAMDASGTAYSERESVVNLASKENEKVCLYAQWSANRFTVKYDENGGSGAMSPTEFIFDESKSLSKNTFTRRGFSFVEWSTSPDGSRESYSDCESVKNLVSVNNKTVTLYAIWKENRYSIAYHPNGGTGTEASSSHVYGVFKQLTPNWFTREGHHFKGWNTRADGSGEAFSDKERVVNLVEQNNGSLTLYAQWVANTYNVILDEQGGVINAAEITSYVYGVGAELPMNVTKEGCIFAGWYTEKNGQGNFCTRITALDLEDKTFYAHWVTASVYHTTAEDAEYEAIGKTKPYEVEGSGKSSFAIDVPEELRNMLSTGRLRVRITVNGEAALKYCARKRQDIHADASLNVSIGGTAFEEILALTAYGKGGDVGPIYGDEVTGLNSLTVSLALNKASNILELDYQYKVDFKDYTWVFWGEEYPRKVDFSFALNNISYVFYIQ